MAEGRTVLHTLTQPESVDPHENEQSDELSRTFPMLSGESGEQKKNNVEELNIHNSPTPQLMQEWNETTGRENILRRASIVSLNTSNDQEIYFHIDTIVGEIVEDGQDLNTFIDQDLILETREEKHRHPSADFSYFADASIRLK